jgi:HAD superfamily hydrolase (TIGR01509 family)
MPTDIHDLPSPSALVFDLDGTLVDTVETRIAAWIQALDDAGFPTDRETLAPLIGVDGKRLASEVAAIAGRPIDDRTAEEIDRRSGELYQRLNRSPRPLPGVPELVEVVEARGIEWAIATSSRKEQVATSVAALELEREPTIVDASHVKHAKPEPDLLLLAARQLRLEPARCWYIGDSTWDMVSAVAAGMIAIGVTAGSAVDEAALSGAGAATVVETLAEIGDALAAR